MGDCDPPAVSTIQERSLAADGRPRAQVGLEVYLENGRGKASRYEGNLELPSLPVAVVLPPEEQVVLAGDSQRAKSLVGQAGGLQGGLDSAVEQGYEVNERQAAGEERGHLVARFAQGRWERPRERQPNDGQGAGQDDDWPQDEKRDQSHGVVFAPLSTVCCFENSAPLQ